MQNLPLPLPAIVIPPNMVDINHGLRRVDIQCDIIDKCSNININGQPSNILTSIPIPTDKTLKGSLCYYNNINTSVKISRGTYNSIGFKVFGNNEQYACDVLLELHIKSVKRWERTQRARLRRKSNRAEQSESCKVSRRRRAMM